MRQAGGRVFADVVIGVSFDAAVGQGHAAADAVERALESALPEADVVVHVEPMESDAAVRERALAAALGVPRVREVHNVSVLAVGSGNELSLHLKLPGRPVARRGARRRRAGRARDPRGGARAHLACRRTSSRWPRRRPGGPRDNVAADRETVAQIVRDATGAEPEELRFVRIDDGLVAYLTRSARRRPRRSRRRTRGRARSRRRSAASCPRSPT